MMLLSNTTQEQSIYLSILVSNGMHEGVGDACRDAGLHETRHRSQNGVLPGVRHLEYGFEEGPALAWLDRGQMKDNQELVAIGKFLNSPAHTGASSAHAYWGPLSNQKSLQTPCSAACIACQSVSVCAWPSKVCRFLTDLLGIRCRAIRRLLFAVSAKSCKGAERLRRTLMSAVVHLYHGGKP